MNRDERRKTQQRSVREFFDRHYQPNFLVGAAPKTHRAYREMLDHWEELTVNPRLMDVESETLAGFKARLSDPRSFVMKRRLGRRKPQMMLFDLAGEELQQKTTPPKPKPLARATVNKQLRHLGAILAKAGPPGPRNRDALGVLEFVPWTKPLREYRRLPRDVKDELIGAIYRAAVTARFPILEASDSGAVDPGHWWKALIVTALTTGLRHGGLLALPWTAVDFEAGEIRLPAEADKCRDERCKPVGQLLLLHLLRIRSGQELVFAFPHAERTFYREWHRLQDAAGLKEAEHIGLHDLKRACGTRLAKVASPWVVQKRLDHSSLATSRFYVNATEEEREACERMSIPAAFVEEFADHYGEEVG